MEYVLKRELDMFETLVGFCFSECAPLDIDMAGFGIDIFFRGAGFLLAFLLERGGSRSFGFWDERFLTEDIASGFFRSFFLFLRRWEGSAFLKIENDGAGHIKLIDEHGAQELPEMLPIHPQSVFLEIFERQETEEFRRGEDDLVSGQQAPAGNFDECLDGVDVGFFGSQPGAYF